MDKLQLQLELCEKPSIDFITNKLVEESILIIAGRRNGDAHIYLGINTLVEIGDFLRSHGIRTGLPEKAE